MTRTIARRNGGPGLSPIPRGPRREPPHGGAPQYALEDHAEDAHAAAAAMFNLAEAGGAHHGTQQLGAGLHRVAASEGGGGGGGGEGLEGDAFDALEALAAAAAEHEGWGEGQVRRWPGGGGGGLVIFFGGGL
jgi:hypothetical protein